MKVEALKGPLHGLVGLPGDKSMSHRALIFAALARSPSSLRHLGSGADNRATINCLRALGARIDSMGEDAFVHPAPLKAANAPLDCMNSGTTMRLLSGLLAGAGVDATLIGDESLSRRPMKRVAEPLSKLGARVDTVDGHAPVTVHKQKLVGTDVVLSEPSAQVKTAIILAGLFADGVTTVREPELTRDHSERMLGAIGFGVTREGDTIKIVRGEAPEGFQFWVPGDPSSAAFWSVLAAVTPGSDVTIIDVSLNPTRIGFTNVLKRMGVHIETTTHGESAGEPWGDIRVKAPQFLTATDVGGHEARLAIDELPVLAVAMAHARGRSVVSSAKDLRAKESDRIETTAALLQSSGVEVETFPDGFAVVGGKPTAGRVNAHGDHRIALSAAVLGLSAKGVEIDGYESAAVSYGHFLSEVKRLSAKERVRGKPVTVAIDGPAGAGKSTVSKRLADRLGYALVDTGAIYRAVALLVSRAGVNPNDAEAVAALARGMEVTFAPSPAGQRVVLGQGQTKEDVTEAIRTPAMSSLASVVSQHPPVRAALLTLQRELAGQGGAVLEGRDIGTVVFPQAQAKFFLDAAPEERARRRVDELSARKTPADYAQVLAEIRDRDARDAGREAAPLKAAADAVHLDSTRLDISDVVNEMERRVRAKET